VFHSYDTHYSTVNSGRLLLPAVFTAVTRTTAQ
jgi:hypothetical protein